MKADTSFAIVFLHPAVVAREQEMCTGQTLPPENNTRDGEKKVKTNLLSS